MFLTVFKVSWFWVQFEPTKLPNSNSVDNFASLDTHGGPGGLNNGVICISAVLWMLAPPGEKIWFLQIEA